MDKGSSCFIFQNNTNFFDKPHKNDLICYNVFRLDMKYMSSFSNCRMKACDTLFLNIDIKYS